MPVVLRATTVLMGKLKPHVLQVNMVMPEAIQQKVSVKPVYKGFIALREQLASQQMIFFVRKDTTAQLEQEIIKIIHALQEHIIINLEPQALQHVFSAQQGGTAQREQIILILMLTNVRKVPTAKLGLGHQHLVLTENTLKLKIQLHKVTVRVVPQDTTAPQVQLPHLLALLVPIIQFKKRATSLTVRVV